MESKKYSEVNKPSIIKDGQLRVWHIPQVPMCAFYIYVDTIQDARIVLDTLALYDLFQFENRIKPDYCNAAGLEIFIHNEWQDWNDADGNDIDSTVLLEEV